MTETELLYLSVRPQTNSKQGLTYESAMASEAQTGLNLACPAGYITPAAIGNAAKLYIAAHAYGSHRQ